MDSEMVTQVRRFNRIVTERVGALNDHFLSLGRPLGEARLLWEIGSDGCDVRSLRSRLDLDSGYLSRLLRSLEVDGLITVERTESDGRVRTARPTASGAAELAELERRSDDHAASLLEPLSSEHRKRLVTAMGDVERLLTATMVRIESVDPSDAAAQHCLGEYFAELDRRFDTGFDPAQSTLPDADDLRPPAGLMLVASLRAEPIGCGALRFHDDQPTDIKRMWIAESARGIGLGRRLLEALEASALQRGSSVVRLETNRSLSEAISMYRSAGYVEVDAFNDELYAHHWFEKQLGGTASGR
jgi:DNA-binding MarR family transcriptional regulator/GNAT superfamily N-acetyltransferase